jgi:hypothetical protein
MKRALFLGLVAGLLAAVAAIIYQRVYTNALGADFSEQVKTVTLVIICTVASLLAGFGYWLLTKWLQQKGEIIFNFLLAIVSFATILGPFATKLPLTVEMPELFPGLTVPMHFFPALAWFTLKPLFIPGAGLQVK